MKRETAMAVVLFGVLGALGALPLSGSAQSSTGSDTCVSNCAKVANTQMQQTTTTTTQASTDEGVVTTTTQTPANPPDSVYNALNTCISNCLGVTNGQ